jgi:hypothetical protein
MVITHMDDQGRATRTRAPEDIHPMATTKTQKSADEIAAELDELDDETDPEDEDDEDEPIDASSPDAYKATEARMRKRAERAIAKMVLRQKASLVKARDRWNARIQLKLDELALSEGGTAANPKLARQSFERQIERLANQLEEARAKLAQLPEVTDEEPEAVEA